MGVIESALIGWGMSAATASAATAGIVTAGAGALAGAAVSAAAPKPQMPKIPDPIKPPTPTQASQAPQRATQRLANAATGGLGNSSTFLTGPGGIDPGTLNLGRNTLLGQ